MRKCDYCGKPAWGIGTIVLHPACEAKLGMLYKKPKPDDDEMLMGEMIQELRRVRGEYEQFIIDRERERIIKLLEATDLLKTIEGGSLINYADDAIALIKGDQK